MPDLSARVKRIRLPHAAIAARAGVDKNTVTAVLHGRPHHSTSADAVRAAVENEERALHAYLNGLYPAVWPEAAE